MIEEKGSFRDPAGKIYYKNDRVFRKLTTLGINRFLELEQSDIISKSIKKGFLIETKEVENKDNANEDNKELILQHEKIQYIS